MKMRKFQEGGYWGKLAGEIWEGLFDLVYPPRCLVCHTWMERGCFCDGCIDKIEKVAPPFCGRCGLPINEGHPLCERCEKRMEPAYNWSQTLGRYGGALREAIHRFKYDGKTALAEPLGTLLARSLDSPPSPLLTSPGGDPLKFDLIVPVPLHPSRYRHRGFNQAELLARVVSRERKWPIDTAGIRRVRHTRTQALLVRSERTDNVRGAFLCSPPQRYTGQSVLVLDDVLTTGSTLDEVARTIRQAGAERVCIVALARG